MTLYFAECSVYGKVIFIIATIAFVIFISSVVVLANNEKENWEGKKFGFYLLPLLYPRASVAEEYASWYPIYKYSGLVCIPSVIVLFTGSYQGYLCTLN